MSETEVRIFHINTWDQIEKKSFRYGCEIWFTNTRIYTPWYKTAEDNRDTQVVIRKYLNDRGKSGVDWKVQKFNLRMIVEFQSKAEWLAFLLVFK